MVSKIGDIANMGTFACEHRSATCLINLFARGSQQKKISFKVEELKQLISDRG